MPHKFTSEQMESIEEKINQMVDNLVELRELILETGISQKDCREIRFLNELNTALSGDVEGLKEYMVDKFNLQTFRDWKNKQEIYSDEDIKLKIEFESGNFVEVGGTFNFASGLVNSTSEEMCREDIKQISFEWESETYIVCLDCGEGILIQNKCSNCGY